MPAVRKPTAILEASGAFKANPDRARANEPDTGRGVGPPPAKLAKEIRRAWDDIVRDTAPGVWQSSDRVFLAVLAEQVARWRADPGGFGIQRMGTFLTMLARAGMTPADRSRVQVPKQHEDGKAKTGLASFR